MAGFKPMLAATLEDPSTLDFPVLASPKIDGIRAIVMPDGVVSRSLKPIRNEFISKILSVPQLEGLDGEIIVGENSDSKLFRNTTSGVMSADGEPNFTYWVFDYAKFDGPFAQRLAIARNEVEAACIPQVKFLPHVIIGNVEELLAYEEKVLSEGYEGVMVRKIDGSYKFGRSTLKEGLLLKMKQFIDEEATVTGFVESKHNANEATTNALGRSERSTHKENMIPRGDLGALKAINSRNEEFEVGTGFTDAERKEIWDNKDQYMGKIFTYKRMVYGDYTKPRIPTFKGFRPTEDMS